MNYRLLSYIVLFSFIFGQTSPIVDLTNEIASPDGVSAIELDDGTKRLAVVDQWNSRILIYDLDKILNIL